MPSKTSTKKTAAKKQSSAGKKPVAVAPVKKAVKAPSTASKTSMSAQKETYFYANGKRKTSVASVRIYQNGKGMFTVNNRTLENYFPVFTDRDKILSPLRIVNKTKDFDISARVHGGGVHSQAEAVRHGISKALLQFDVSHRTALKSAGFLTRDSRVKERKKYGLKRARRAPQFSKR